MREALSGRSIVQAVNTAADLAILSMLWTICSLPVVTLGLASAALYHTVELVIVQGRGAVISTFARSLRENWRCALPLGALLSLCCGAAVTVACISYQNETGVLLLPFLMCAAALLFLVTVQIYLYPLLGHFVLNLGQLVAMALQLTLLHPLRSLLLLVLFLCAAFLALYYPPVLMLVPAGYMFLASKIFAPLFSRYIRISSSEPAPEEPSSGSGCGSPLKEG